MFVETVFHRIVCCVWSSCVVYVTRFMYTCVCVYAHFLCGELASFSSSSLYSLQLEGPLGSHR